MLTEIELEGIVGDLKNSMLEMFPNAIITNHVREAEGSIIVYLTAPGDEIPEIEEELASKSVELETELNCEFIFVVKDENLDDPFAV